MIKREKKRTLETIKETDEEHDYKNKSDPVSPRLHTEQKNSSSKDKDKFKNMDSRTPDVRLNSKE